MIDKIVNVGNKPESIDPNRSNRVRDRKDSKERKVESRRTAESGSDSVSISDKAKSRSDVGRLADMVRDLPEVREDKVREAREKVDSGAVFDSAVTEKLADIIDKSL
jgi:anti-sigma28 factor (negative regulator of flagellin synthesis)